MYIGPGIYNVLVQELSDRNVFLRYFEMPQTEILKKAWTRL